MPNFFPKLLPASPVGLDPTCPPCFTWPLPSFLLLVCFICFPQRPSCPKFRLSGLYNLCPLPAFPVGLEPICPPRLQSLCCLFTFRSCRSFPAKTFLSEIPSFRSLQSLSHANITISPKTDLPENLSRLRAVFPADLLLHLYFLSLSRCFLFLISHVPFFLLYCKIANYFFLRFPFSLFFPSSLIACKNYPIRIAFTRPLPSFSLFAYVVRFPQRPSCPKFRLRGLYNLCPFPASPSARKPTCPSLFTEPLLSFYFSLVSFVSRKDLPVRNSVSMVFTVFAPCLHHHQPENRPVREPVSAPRRFSCQSFVQTLFSIAFALFSVFSLQVLFLFDLTLYFFSQLAIIPSRPIPCSSCLFS